MENQVPEKYIGQRTTGSGKLNLAKTVGLPGLDTPMRIESPSLVAERYHLSLEGKRIDRKLAAIDPILKAKTGERQVGDYLVSVASFTVERVDVDAVKELLGENTPMKATPSVRLTVVPA